MSDSDKSLIFELLLTLAATQIACARERPMPNIAWRAISAC
jgi:hypothetical protein